MQKTLFSRRGFIAGSSAAVLALRAAPLHALAGAGSVTLRTPSGPLRGEQAAGVNVFRGVPFAEPPVGPLRFRAPVAVKPWTAVHDATRFRAAAMQAGAPGLEQSEDCLYLNIWAPAGAPGNRRPLPVYVWIHGGGFTSGSAFEPMFDGSMLARQGIVCITVAYRLGIFGFLDVEPLLGAGYAGSANNALRDLMTALDWVRHNMEAFGGDPTRVTIGGESAGAKLTDTLMGTAAARPLFQQMISESGGAERVFTREQGEEVAQGFSKAWRAQSGDTSLLAAPADALIETQKQFLAAWPHRYPLRCQVGDALLPLRPVESIAAGSSRGKRLLLGTNRDESAAFLGAHPAGEPGSANLANASVVEFDAVFARYRGVYPHMTDAQLRIRAVTAEEYWVPSLRVADAHIQGGGAAFVYRLDFSRTSGALQGYAFHGLDIPLVWDRPLEHDKAEAELATEMHHAWVAFLRGETPGASGVPGWPEYNAQSRPTMVFDVDNRVEQRPQEAELRLWDGVL